MPREKKWARANHLLSKVKRIVCLTRRDGRRHGESAKRREEVHLIRPRSVNWTTTVLASGAVGSSMGPPTPPEFQRNERTRLVAA